MGKVTDYYGADIRRYSFHGLVRSGYPRLNMSRSGADFFGCVTERISAATNFMDYCGADIRRKVFFTERFI